MFEAKQYGPLTIYQAPNLSKENKIVHGFSCRLNGYSQAPYQGLNLGLMSNDNTETVQKNRIAFVNALGIDSDQVVCGMQVHETNIARVTAKDGGSGFLDLKTAIPDTDGLVTSEPGVALMTFYADCVPILMYDAKEQVIAVCHCGWRGTVNRMAAKTAAVMINEYGCRAEQLSIAIGPSISQNQYEVDTTVLEQFERAFDFSNTLIVPTDDTHGKVDLWKANQLQLEEIGVLPQQIAISGLCTYENVDRFYSHRAERGITGRNGAILMLKK